MKIAVIKEGICINITTFKDMETAGKMFDMGAFGNADGVVELADGYGIGDKYIAGEWVYVARPEPEMPEYIPQKLSVEKSMAIAQTKQWLESELEKGMIWTDEKLYNITREKQNYLSAQLQIGILQILGGAEPESIVLQWNESGKSHEDWGYLRLVELASYIHEYVEELVIKQQEAEEEVNGANTYDEIQAILQNFI